MKLLIQAHAQPNKYARKAHLILARMALSIDAQNAVFAIPLGGNFQGSCFAIVADYLREHWNTVNDNSRIVMLITPQEKLGKIGHAILVDREGNILADRYERLNPVYVMGRTYTLPVSGNEGKGQSVYEEVMFATVREFKDEYFR
jgi:hypothetical protein